MVLEVLSLICKAAHEKADADEDQKNKQCVSKKLGHFKSAWSRSSAFFCWGYHSSLRVLSCRRKRRRLGQASRAKARGAEAPRRRAHAAHRKEPQRSSSPRRCSPTSRCVGQLI